MTNTQIRSIIGIATAVVAYLLAQPDVALPPYAKVFLGAVAVALAVINVPDDAETDDPGV